MHVKKRCAEGVDVGVRVHDVVRRPGVTEDNGSSSGRNTMCEARPRVFSADSISRPGKPYHNLAASL